MDVEKTFSKLGGYFLTTTEEIIKLLSGIRVFVFDWDGVFNNGMKTGQSGSLFSEIDSMGINLLRLSFWLKNGNIPSVFIITGMQNHTAVEFSRREHFDGIFVNCKDKKTALDKISEKLNISTREIAFTFDDVIDLGAAINSGLSFFVDNKSDPLLADLIKDRRIGNYITAFSGNDHAIREICTMLISLAGNYDQVVDARIKFKGQYSDYLEKRSKIETEVLYL
jgi:3-deoxy-D-manno-octulosonate 8-phosphate phosphatase (KDO 8-P phosphatase)